MLFGRVPPVLRTVAICAFAAPFVVGALTAPAAHADSATAAAAQDSTVRASGVNTPLALAGFAVLSSGLLVLGRSRGSQGRTGEQHTLVPAQVAPVMLAPPAAGPPHRSPPPDPAALVPLAAVAGALHATAGALESIAPGLSGPAAATVAASAERIREAQVTIARWLETRG